MTIVLGREPPVGRCERSVDLPNIDDAPIRCPFQNERLRPVGEFNERLALRECREPPPGETECAQPSHRGATLQDFTTSSAFRHGLSLPTFVNNDDSQLHRRYYPDSHACGHPFWGPADTPGAVTTNSRAIADRYRYGNAS